jgi:predicted methyltransferase
MRRPVARKARRGAYQLSKKGVLVMEFPLMNHIPTQQIDDRQSNHFCFAGALLLFCLMMSACLALAAGLVVDPDMQRIVDSPDRSDDDRETDARRRPAEMLTFFGVAPAMSVLDIGTGRGYTAELLARVVGSEGSVVAQNDSFISEKFLKGNTPARFDKEIMRNVQYVVRPYDDPIPPRAGPFDLITVIFVYHDMEWLGRDRAAMNRKLFHALKPGGHVIVVDHAGNTGSGVSQSQTIHRIEETVVRQEFADAGFELAEEAMFLRNPDDPRTESFREATIPVDRFVLKFRRP